jgi:hypothetical protein
MSSTVTALEVAPVDRPAISLSSERGTAVKPYCSIGFDMIVLEFFLKA